MRNFDAMYDFFGFKQKINSFCDVLYKIVYSLNS